MSITTQVRAYNGISKYLSKYDIGKPKNKSYRAEDEHLNNILISFLKTTGKDWVKNNSPNYRGSFSPVLENSLTVQDNFKSFAQYINENYERI